MATTLLARGVFVNAVIPPAVPRGTAMLRFSVMATHSPGQIDKAVETIAQVKAEIHAALAAA
jgi:7-keto-8-aminopelargonate synthetase-like enzyme